VDLSDFLTRVTATQPAPTPRTVAVLAVVALVLVGPSPVWRRTRMLMTIAHEAGHAVVGRLCGRQVSGIKLNADTSGVTLTRGRASGPGMVATLFAGYPAPAVVGVAAAATLAYGHAVALLWGFLAAVVLMLLAIRNVYGGLVLLVIGGALAAATYWLTPAQQGLVAHLLGWILVLGAARPVVELLTGPRRAGSDPVQLARVTRLPYALWLGLFVLVALAGLVAGVGLMLAPTGVLDQVPWPSAVTPR